jgi:hypothetical protein
MPRPWRPVRELEAELQSGHLSVALAAAHQLQDDGQRISLAHALELLGLIAVKRPEDFDRWALRWLARYVTERCQGIEDAADVASLLEELAREPAVVEKLRDYVQ